nr:unnamed protein product [Callosobruchus chinensis]
MTVRDEIPMGVTLKAAKIDDVKKLPTKYFGKTWDTMAECPFYKNVILGNTSQVTAHNRKYGEAVETAKHVIFDCPALCRRRSSYLEIVQEEGRQGLDKIYPTQSIQPEGNTNHLYHNKKELNEKKKI